MPPWVMPCHLKSEPRRLISRYCMPHSQSHFFYYASYHIATPPHTHTHMNSQHTIALTLTLTLSLLFSPTPHHTIQYLTTDTIQSHTQRTHSHRKNRQHLLTYTNTHSHTHNFNSPPHTHIHISTTLNTIAEFRFHTYTLYSTFYCNWPF